MSDAQAWLILDTAVQSRVGVVRAGQLLAEETLGRGRMQNRHLVPALGRVLAQANLTRQDLTTVVVNAGPGSYTGLRVGVTLAKCLAYSLGCQLYALSGFEALAWDLRDVPELAILADALQGQVYVQSFQYGVATAPLQIQSFEVWQQQCDAKVVLAGPAVQETSVVLPPDRTIPHTAAHLLSFAHVAHQQKPVSHEQLLQLEPWYLRGSSAEEKAKREQSAQHVSEEKQSCGE